MTRSTSPFLFALSYLSYIYLSYICPVSTLPRLNTIAQHLLHSVLQVRFDLYISLVASCYLSILYYPLLLLHTILSFSVTIPFFYPFCFPLQLYQIIKLLLYCYKLLCTSECVRSKISIEDYKTRIQLCFPVKAVEWTRTITLGKTELSRQLHPPTPLHIGRV